MKTLNKLTIIAALLLAAGCAKDSKQAKYTESPNSGYSPITGATPYSGTESITRSGVATSLNPLSQLLSMSGNSFSVPHRVVHDPPQLVRSRRDHLRRTL